MEGFLRRWIFLDNFFDFRIIFAGYQSLQSMKIIISEFIKNSDTLFSCEIPDNSEPKDHNRISMIETIERY